MSTNSNQHFLRPEIRELIFSDIGKKRPKEDLANNYQFFLYDLILKLIMYFQPFDIKLASLSGLNSEIKTFYLILNKVAADNFLNNLQYNQLGEVITIQIRKRLFEQYQILIEIEGQF